MIMKINDFAEPGSHVLDAAKDAGFAVSQSQLARCPRGGLLPTPRQQRLGRGKGSRTFYRIGTTKQLLVLCRLHEKEKSLAIVGWRLWVQGYAVADGYWRPMFRDVALSWDTERSRLARTVYPGNAKEPSRRALKLLAERAARVDNPFFARMRKRVRTRQRSPKDKLIDERVSEDYRAHATDDFEFLVRTVVDIFLGRFLKWPGSENKYDQSDEGRVIDRAMGIHKARVNQIPRIGPMLVESAAPVFARLSELFKVPMAKYRDRASDQDLFDARDEWFAILSLSMELAQYSSGPSVSMLSHSATPGNFLMFNPASQALLILLWHVARHHVVDREQVSRHLELAREVAGTVGAFDKLRGGMEQNPEYQKLVEPRRIRGAIRNPRKQAAVTAELGALATAEIRKA